MTKTETQIMKGVAILLMVFLHLFNRTENVDLCTHSLFIGDMPFVQWLHYATNPVAFFLVLSGVGMYSIFKKGQDINRWKRIRKIFVHLWLTLAFFTTIGYLIGINYYNDVYQVLSNYLGLSCSWNAELWFLFPYLCLMLLSPWIFKLSDKFSCGANIIFLFCLYVLTSFIISRYGSLYLYRNLWLYNPLLVLHLLPAFVFGGLIIRSEIINKIRTSLQSFCKSSYLIALVLGSVLIMVVVIVCLVRVSVTYPFYASIFTILFIALPRHAVINKALYFLGHHSMNIWFVHTWLCYYLFHDWIYSFKYPIIIYIVVLSLSLICSIGINKFISLLGAARKFVIFNIR